MDISLIISAFIAGILMFLAPCTLPLLPGYIGFIGGATIEELAQDVRIARKKVLLNGLLYVIGFSAVFILFGVLFGLGGQALIQYREWLARIGGIVVIIFGLYMLFGERFPLFTREFRFNPFRHLEPGRPASSLVFGATFAFGWTPCIGPILGTVLLLASTTATVGKGAWLLFIFSLGLAIPFMLVASGMSAAASAIKRYKRFLRGMSIVGGLFIIFLGVLLVTDSFGEWLKFAYQLFGFMHYQKLLEYL